MQLLAPALRILGRDPIISHFSGNFMNKQKSSLENLLFVLDLQKTSVQWRRMIVKKPLKNFNALVDSLHYRMKAKTSKGPPDIGDFPKRIGAWIRAFSAEALRLFSTPISSAIFIPSQLQILQKCCCTKMIYAMHLFYTKATASFMYRKCNNIFTIFGHTKTWPSVRWWFISEFWISWKSPLILTIFFTISFFFQGAGHNDVELYNQYLERLRHFVSQELTNWHKAEATETASASATSNTNNQVSNNVVKNEPKSQDQTTNNTTTTATKTTTGNNTNTTTSSSSLSISNQDSADKTTTKNNSEKFLWKADRPQFEILFGLFWY